MKFTTTLGRRQRSITVVAALWFLGCAGSPAPEGPQDVPEAQAPARSGGAGERRIAEEGIGLSQIGVRWETPASALPLTDAIEASIENRGDDPIRVELRLLGLGLDQREAHNALEQLTLEAHSSRQVQVPIASLPVQSLTAPAQTWLVAGYENPQGELVHMPSDLLHVRFQEGYAAAQVLSPDAPTELASSTPEEIARAERTLLDHALVAPRGRYLQDGEWLEPSRDGEVIYGEARTFDSDTNLPAKLFAGEQPFPTTVPSDDGLVDKARQWLVCVWWRALYADSNLGEDRLLRSQNAFGTTANTASYASFALLDATTGQWVAGGNLGKGGCTQATLEDNHNFIMIAIPDMNFNGRNVSVRDFEGSGSWRWYTANFYSASSSLNIIKLYTGIDELTNAATVAAELHIEPELELPAGNYPILAKQGCGADGSACYNTPTSTVHLGYSELDFHSMTSWKYIVAHELGHMASHRMFGGFPIRMYDAPENNAVCRCDHVAEPTIRGHCLQSTEYAENALEEGWAHFYAAVIFNYRSQSDCAYLYYKEFQLPNGGALERPPVGKNCATPILWYKRFCQQQDWRGNEWDWLNFYWNLYSVAPQISLGELADVHRRACGNANQPCPWDAAVGFAHVHNAALAKWGAGSPKYNHFVQAAINYGVDH